MWCVYLDLRAYDEDVVVGEALDRLAQVLPVHAPEVWSSLRPPVGEADLHALREAVAPFELPGEVVELLRWADGQEESAPWWPVLEAGRLLSATEAAAYYKWLREEADLRRLYGLIVPIAHEGWDQAGVELVSDAPGAVIHYGFGDQPRVLAPTLAAMLDVTAQMVAAGIGEPKENEDARVWRARRAELSDERAEWELWPYDRVIGWNAEDWPPHWRAVRP